MSQINLNASKKTHNFLIDKLRNKKILLVGANGFLGKYFVKTFERFIEKQKILFSLDCYDNHISSKKSEFSELSNNKY